LLIDSNAFFETYEHVKPCEVVRKS